MASCCDWIPHKPGFSICRTSDYHSITRSLPITARTVFPHASSLFVRRVASIHQLNSYPIGKLDSRLVQRISVNDPPLAGLYIRCVGMPHRASGREIVHLDMADVESGSFDRVDEGVGDYWGSCVEGRVSP